uniref:Uncharacterized protein n=1 Tax=Candidatus Methanophagaceae archaeon ANME-1 ERB6 TaxID=2759912 RepID=A0A7G9YYY8_9EURY|nr:hypothetical protein HNLOENAD_00022 [Methanosarcinales archaeon ANME-1 ERB6]
MKSKEAGASLVLVALVLLSLVSVSATAAPAAAVSKEVLSPFGFLTSCRASRRVIMIKTRL